MIPVSNTGWQFRALGDHIAGAGGILTFNFSNDMDGSLRFTIHAHGPLDDNWLGRTVKRIVHGPLFASHVWSGLGRKVTCYYKRCINSPGTATSMTRRQSKKLPTRRRRTRVLAGVVVAGMLALGGVILLDDPLGLYAGDGPNPAEESLHFAVPRLRERLTVQRYDAARLMREGHARHLRDLIFLPEAEVSRGVREVSVWPASESVWVGAVGHADGRCFAIMADFGTGLSPHRQIKVVPEGTTCNARAAARTTFPEVVD